MICWHQGERLIFDVQIACNNKVTHMVGHTGTSKADIRGDCITIWAYFWPNVELDDSIARLK